MADVVDKATRSRMMSGIRSHDTKIELAIRKALFAQGFRYRLNNRDLPGRPDIVLPKYRAAIFVHGCFWHGHDCPYFRWPASNAEFWREKITKNMKRDQSNWAALTAMGWRHLTVWECALKGASAEAVKALADQLANWLKSKSGSSQIKGKA